MKQDQPDSQSKNKNLHQSLSKSTGIPEDEVARVLEELGGAGATGARASGDSLRSLALENLRIAFRMAHQAVVR